MKSKQKAKMRSENYKMKDNLSFAVFFPCMYKMK